MSYQAQTWVDEVGINLCKNGGEAFVLVRVANHTGPDLRGCYASAGSIARLCKMGRSTVLKHMRELLARGVLLPGDPGLTEHLPADKRPPVYDLVAGHEPGCVGAHTIREDCRIGAGVHSEHREGKARRAGARNEHPQKKRRSAGVQSEHPEGPDGGAGVQNELQRVFKSSTNSCIELKLLSPCLVSGPSGAAASADLKVVTEERENPAPQNDTATTAPAAAADIPPESLVAALCEAWASGAGIPRTPTTIARQIATQAAGLTAAYPNPVQQQAIARFAGERRWQDLERAAMHPDCARRIHAATQPARQAPVTGVRYASSAQQARADAITNCGTCDEYGEIVTPNGAVAICRHTPPATQTAA